jgi:hypothetical protein
VLVTEIRFEGVPRPDQHGPAISSLMPGHPFGKDADGSSQDTGYRMALRPDPYAEYNSMVAFLCLHLPLLHLQCGRGRLEQALLRQKEERSVAAQECELRDHCAGGLRRHHAEVVRVIIGRHRQAQRLEPQVYLLYRRKIDMRGLAGINV